MSSYPDRQSAFQPTGAYGSAFTTMQQQTRLSATPTSSSRALRFEEVPYTRQTSAGTPPSAQSSRQQARSPNAGLTPEVLLAAEAIEGMRYFGNQRQQQPLNPASISVKPEMASPIVRQRIVAAATSRHKSASPMVQQVGQQVGRHTTDGLFNSPLVQQQLDSLTSMYGTPESDMNSASNESWTSSCAGQSNDSVARRRLNLDSVAASASLQSTSPAVDSTSTVAQRIAHHRKRKSSLEEYASPGRCSPLVPQALSRQESSLLVLTKRFLQIQGHYDHGTVNLNEVADCLGVQKRRLYDITNVLEGIDLIEKIGKNSIRWRDEDREASSSAAQAKILEDDINQLEEQERNLDSITIQLQNAIKLATEDPTDSPYAYVSHADLRETPQMKEQTVIAIRAPSGSDLEVPDPKETGKMQMLVRSHNQDEIQVFLCKTEEQLQNEMLLHQQQLMQNVDEQSPHTSSAAADVNFKQPKEEGHNFAADPLSTVDPVDWFHLEELDALSSTFHPSPTKGLANALQPLPHPSPGSTFLNLEPPPVSEMNEYLYGLGPDEGINDLFDSFCDNNSDSMAGLMTTPPNRKTDSSLSSQENRDPLDTVSTDTLLETMKY